jgi:restriction system protein
MPHGIATDFTTVPSTTGGPVSGAWVIRAGRSGERDQWALTNGFSGGGWKEAPDLTPCQSRDDVAAVVRSTWPAAAEGRLSNYTAQLWALRGRIEPGDLIALPLKTTKQIAIGRVASGYFYRADEPEPDKRHVVKVEWLRTDLPRTAVKQDLLFTLGSAMSIFAPSKNAAEARLESLLTHGADPGTSSSTSTLKQSAATATLLTEVDEPELAADIEQVALDRITARIAEDFAGHALATLVAAILNAEGFVCMVSPPGPDGGIDIAAGRGVLGLDSPHLLVQVKSGSQIGAPIVTQLHGVMTTHGADQGLLVAWGGLSKPARDAMKNQHLRVRVWEASDVVDAVLRTYDQLPEEIRTQLPLRRVWMLADSGP